MATNLLSLVRQLEEQHQANPRAVNTKADDSDAQSVASSRARKSDQASSQAGDKTCRYCHKEGHFIRECPMYRCAQCGSQQHFTNACPHHVCHKCNKFAADELELQLHTEGWCWCIKFGEHQAHECIKRICRWCEQMNPDHAEFSCSERKCVWCNEADHDSRDCSERPCRKCNNERHSVQDCPRRLQCHCCHKYGHKAVECTLPLQQRKNYEDSVMAKMLQDGFVLRFQGNQYYQAKARDDDRNRRLRLEETQRKKEERKSEKPKTEEPVEVQSHAAPVDPEVAQARKRQERKDRKMREKQQKRREKELEARRAASSKKGAQTNKAHSVAA